MIHRLGFRFGVRTRSLAAASLLTMIMGTPVFAQEQTSGAAQGGVETQPAPGTAPAAGAAAAAGGLADSAPPACGETCGFTGEVGAARGAASAGAAGSVARMSGVGRTETPLVSLAWSG